MKATLLTKVKDKQIGGSSSIMQTARTILEHHNINPGHIHSIHRIHFSNPQIYAVHDYTGSPSVCPCYMLTLKAEVGDIRLFYIVHGFNIIKSIYIGKNSSIQTPIYQKYKSQFLQVPDPEKLIQFLKSIPLAQYE